MKCRHCENELPKSRGFAKIDAKGNLIPGKIACCMEGCISYGLKPGSKKFQELVMGRSSDEIQRRWAERIAKTTYTNRIRGNLLGDKNPASKKRLVDKGLTEEQVSEFLSKKAKKGAKTKSNSGYYLDKSNNPYSYDFFGLSKDYLNNNLRIR